MLAASYQTVINHEQMNCATHPLLPSDVSNNKCRKLCAADGWIDKGWGHVPRTLLKLSG